MASCLKSCLVDLGRYPASPSTPLMHLRLIFSTVFVVVTVATAAAQRLKIGVVQLAQSSTIEASRERMVAQIGEAAQRGARVVVLPEAALNGNGDDNPALVDAAVTAIRGAARENK